MSTSRARTSPSTTATDTASPRNRETQPHGCSDRRRGPRRGRQTDVVRRPRRDLACAWFVGGDARFPRYGQSVHADLGAEALRGGHGDTASSIEAMALLWALDRRDAADELRKLLADNDIVLLDRYVASNAAYTAARHHESRRGPRSGGCANSSSAGLLFPRRICKCCCGSPWIWRPSVHARGKPQIPRAIGMHTNATAICRHAPVRCTTGSRQTDGCRSGLSPDRIPTRNNSPFRSQICFTTVKE